MSDFDEQEEVGDIDDRMYAWDHRVAVRAQLGAETVSVCWKGHLPQVSFEGYQIIWEFLMKSSSRGIYSKQGRVMASIALDMISHNDGIIFNSVIQDVETIYAGFTGKPPIGVPPQAAGGPPRAAPAAPGVPYIPGVVNPLWPRFVAAVVNNVKDTDHQDVRQLKTAVEAWGVDPTYDGVLAIRNTFLNAMSTRCDSLRRIHKSIVGHQADAMFLSAVISICYRGSMTDRSIRKMVGGFDVDLEMGNILTSENVRDCYNILKVLFPEERDVGVFFNTMREIYTQDVNLRMNLTIKQTRNAGAAALMISMSAIRESQDCPAWGFLSANAQGEWAAFREAHRIMTEDPYAGFELGRSPPEGLRSTLYPSVTYCALTILKSLDNNDTSTYYRGEQKSPHKANLNTLIATWIATRAAAIQNAVQPVIVWDNFFGAGGINLGN